MFKTARNLIIIFLPLFIVSCSQEYREEWKMDSSQIEEILRAGKIPGACIVIIQDSSLSIKNFGYSNLTTRTPITSSTAFELGYPSTAFVSLAITDLARRNIINLDDSVSMYIPWFSAYYKGERANIQIRHLLYHTSGMPQSSVYYFPTTDGPQAIREAVNTTIGTTLTNRPGTKYNFASVNYDILAFIIERVTNQNIQAYLHTQIFKKVGMHDTGLGRPQDGIVTAQGHKIGFFSARQEDLASIPGDSPASYVLSSGRDIAKWLQLQIGIAPNQALNQAAEITQQRDFSVPSHNDACGAMGWEVALDGTNIVSQRGNNPTYSTFLAFQPETKRGVAVLANSNSPYTAYLGNKLIRTLAGDSPQKDLLPSVENDRICSVLAIGLALYVAFTGCFVAYVLYEVSRKRRSLRKVSAPIIFDIVLRAAFILFVTITALKIFPTAWIGADWETLFRWSPASLVIVITLCHYAIGFTLVAYLMDWTFPSKSKLSQVAPKILLTSLFSGIANAIVIAMVTSAFSTSMPLPYFIFYFLFALFVYVLGRRFVQASLIKFTRNLIYELRAKIIDRLLASPYHRFEKMDRGRIYTSLNDDVNVIGESANNAVMLLTSIATIIGAFIYLSFLAIWIAIVVISFVLIVSLLYYAVVSTTDKYFYQARDTRNVFMRLINNLIDGFKEINLSYVKKSHLKTEITDNAKAFGDKMAYAEVKYTNVFILGETLLILQLGIIAIVFGKVIDNVDVQTAMSFVVVVLYLLGPINGILSSVPRFIKLKVAWERVQAFLNELAADQQIAYDRPASTNTPAVQSLVTKDLRFRYDDRTKGAFEVGPINLEVSQGEILFIIGGNGSGKTTLSKLLTGLYAPTEGAILVNNEMITRELLSECFSVVFNPPFIFDKLYGINTEDRIAIDKYLTLLDLKEKVDINDGLYSTTSLSSGQRKRLGLLQCFLENKPIFLFDEWAADQDPGYRKVFYRELLPEMKRQGKIVIAITHDDHYFDVADKILKMDQGAIFNYTWTPNDTRVLSQ